MNDIFDCKLLIVDDESELRRMVDEILRREGFRKVISAATCKDARQLFAAEKPDGIILDVTLPDGDGFSLMREFRGFLPFLFCFFPHGTKMKTVCLVSGLVQTTI